MMSIAKFARADAPPQSGTVPVSIKENPEAYLAEWLEGGPIADALFEHAVRRRKSELAARGVPAQWTSWDCLEETASDAPADRPAAFIFHTSRCGSTLLTRILAALDDASVIAESIILEQLLNSRAALAASETVRIARLRGFVQAHARSARPGRCWVKFDCHHIFHLDLIRRAFPQTPWVFLYRDPVEIIVSHARQKGLPMVPSETEVLSWPDYGRRPMLELLDEHVARMIGRICTNAAEAHQPGESLLINHRDFTTRMQDELLPFIGVSATDDEFARITRYLQENAKHPGQPFIPDSADKHAQASAVIKQAALRWAQPAYERLEHLSKSARSSRPG